MDGALARTEIRGKHTGVLVVNLEGGDLLGDTVVDERILLKWGNGVWAGFVWSRTGTIGGIL
jgi:hypothetical protein